MGALAVLTASAVFASLLAHWSAEPIIDAAAAKIRPEAKFCQPQAIAR